MPRPMRKKKNLNIAENGTHSNHMCFNGLSSGLFRKRMRINWNLFFADHLTNSTQDIIVFLAQPLAGE